MPISLRLSWPTIWLYAAQFRIANPRFVVFFQHGAVDLGDRRVVQRDGVCWFVARRASERRRSRLFSGLHTPGVQTALLQLAPPYSGVITGISFCAVAVSSISNKFLTKFLVQNGTRDEWALCFYIAAAIAAVPIVVFTLCKQIDGVESIYSV